MSAQRESEISQEPEIIDSEHSDIGIGVKMEKNTVNNKKSMAQKAEQLAPRVGSEMEVDKQGASASKLSRQGSFINESQKLGSLAKDPLGNTQLYQDIFVVEKQLIDQLKNKEEGFKQTMQAADLQNAGQLLDRGNQEITYDKLKAHIIKNHPTTQDKNKDADQDKITKFGMCARLGCLPMCKCCNRQASELAKELGIGASLFLMTTQALMSLFFVLTIINIPIFAFYYSGTQAAESGAEGAGFTDYFALLSLGNAGAGSYACDQASLYEGEYTISLKCGLGTSIGSIKEIGFVKDAQSTCSDLYEFPGALNDHFDQKFKSNGLEVQYIGKSYDTTFFEPVDENDIYQANKDNIFSVNQTTSDCIEKLISGGKLVDYLSKTPFEINYMCQCYGQSECTIPMSSSSLAANVGHTYIGHTWQGLDFSTQTETKIDNQDVRVMAFATCQDLDMPNPFFDAPLTKYDLGYIILAVDLIVIMILLLFIYLIEVGQKNFIEIFNANTITPEDFTLRVKGMPDEKFYSVGGGNKEDYRDETLKALLINHFQSVIKDQMVVTKEPCKDSDAIKDFTDISAVTSRVRANPHMYEIADVCFGKADMDEIPAYKKLSMYRTNYIKMNLEANDDQTSADKKQELEDKMKKMEESFAEFLTKYKEQKNNKGAKDMDDGEAEVKYAFITFRNMEAVRLVKEAYQIGFWNRKCTLCFGSCCCSKKYKAMRKKHFFNKLPNIEDACQPDNINWDNLGFTAFRRNICTGFNWLVAVILIIGSILGMVYFKVQTEKLTAEYKSNYICPADSLTAEVKELAYQDQILTADERVGIVSCYCMAFLSKNPQDIWNVNFSEFTTDGQPENNGDLFCKAWSINYSFQQGMVIGASCVITCINVIACTIFDLMISLEKKHTINEETTSQFTKITIIQFINVAMIVILVNFDLLEEDLLGFIPILNGEYQDFSVQWYAKIGKTLCMTMLIGIFSPHASKLTMPLMKLFFRCTDRGCSCKVLKGEKVNTKKYLQNELNDLYTGDQISGHYVYAQNYTYLWCVLMFSTGIPILYPFAVVMYFGTYWVYKFLLIKFYQKTTKFNYNLPMYTTAYIKVGVFFHIIIGGLMVTNSDIIPSKNDYSLLLEQAQGEAVDAGNEAYDKGSALAARFFSTEQGILYFILIIVLILFIILKNTVLRFLSCICNALWSCCCKSDNLKAGNRCPCIYKEYPIIDLMELYKKASKALQRYTDIDGVDMVHIVKERNEDEEPFDYDATKEMLEIRKREIERTIDDHLEDLYTEGNMFEFEGMSHDLKLQYLLGQATQCDELENKGHAKAKNKDKVWPFKDSRLRLKGLTLSYDVYQSHEFKMLKDIDEIVTSEAQANYKLGQEQQMFSPRN